MNKRPKIKKSAKLKFFRSGGRWYADVPGVSLSNNQMVAGADVFLDAVSSLYGNSPILEAKISTRYIRHWKFKFYLTEHDSTGATYAIHRFYKGESRYLMPGWICNVTHKVLGEHPDKFSIKSILPVKLDARYAKTLRGRYGVRKIG